jgi:putative transposase
MSTYKRHRFPPDIISYAVWLYYRFNLSHRRDAGPFIEDLLAERGITVSREAIRLWCIKFGAIYARRLKRRHGGYGDTFYIDEVFAGVPDHSDQWQATLPLASLRRLLRSHEGEPRKIVTDKLRSYPAAHRELIPGVVHVTDQYANNRAEQSHESTRVRERGMRRFKSMVQAQRFVAAHAAVQNLFNLGRHLVRAEHYRNLRVSAFDEWSRAVA